MSVMQPATINAAQDNVLESLRSLTHNDLPTAVARRCELFIAGTSTFQTFLSEMIRPAAGGKVYVRIKKNTSVVDGVIGGFEAEADGENSILLPNVQWTNGYVDANGVAEITILTRANA